MWEAALCRNLIHNPRLIVPAPTCFLLRIPLKARGFLHQVPALQLSFFVWTSVVDTFPTQRPISKPTGVVPKAPNSSVSLPTRPCLAVVLGACHRRLGLRISTLNIYHPLGETIENPLNPTIEASQRPF